MLHTEPFWGRLCLCIALVGVFIVFGAPMIAEALGIAGNFYVLTAGYGLVFLGANGNLLMRKLRPAKRRKASVAGWLAEAVVVGCCAAFWLLEGRQADIFGLGMTEVLGVAGVAAVLAMVSVMVLPEGKVRRG